MMDFMIRSSHSRTINPMSQQFRMHAHDNCEIFCFVEGDAEYYVEGTSYRLKPGDIMLMRKSESHYLKIRADVPCERYVLSFDSGCLALLDLEESLMRVFNDRPLGMYNHYSAALFPDNHWTFYLKKIFEMEQPNQRLAYLLPLLSELNECFETVKQMDKREGKDPILTIISYINHNLETDISLGDLCDRFFISKAHINRLFKKTTGSTVWSYIVIKRLLMARDMLASGNKPTEVYSRCGFRDYTTFYRSYKKHFGVSPKEVGFQHITDDALRF